MSLGGETIAELIRFNDIPLVERVDFIVTVELTATLLPEQDFRLGITTFRRRRAPPCTVTTRWSRTTGEPCRLRKAGKRERA